MPVEEIALPDVGLLPLPSPSAASAGLLPLPSPSAASATSLGGASPTATAGGRSPSGSGLSPRGEWQTLSQKRLQRTLQCKQHAEEQQKALYEFSEQHEQAVTAAQKRADDLNGARVAALKESARLWLTRSHDAAERRRRLDVSMGAEVMRKHALAAKRRAEQHEREEVARTQRLQEMVRHVLKVQDGARLAGQERVDAALKDLAKVDAATIERANLKKAEILARDERNTYADRMQKAGERKKAGLRTFVVKARKEVVMKEERIERNLHILRRSALEREREVRKERALKETDPGSSPTALGGPASPSGGASTTSSSGRLPKLSGSMSVPVFWEPTPASPIRPLPKRQNGELEEEGGSPEEEEFLQELGSRCGEWLSDLRRNKQIFIC